MGVVAFSVTGLALSLPPD